MNRARFGSSFRAGRLLPDITTIWTGGQRFRTAAASFRPSMEPGMSMSVNTTSIKRLTSTSIALSPLPTEITSCPASRSWNSISMRMSGSSSTRSIFKRVLPPGQRAQSFPSKESRDRFPRKHKRRQVSDIITADELAERRSATADHLREKLAFRDIAHDMANEPNEVSPRLVLSGRYRRGVRRDIHS